MKRKMKLLAFLLCLCCLIFLFQSSTQARVSPLPPTPGRLQPLALPPPSAGRLDDQPICSPPPPGAPPGHRP
ncbi:hypothetical protein Peur_031799 [Populus x canadensis]